MSEYKLYNLDIGQNPISRVFNVGPYEIRLVDNYDQIQKKLSSQILEKYDVQIVNGKNVLEKTEEIPAKVGNSYITAIATCYNEPNAKLSNTNNIKGIWDLCLIFSYLLGRRVYIEEDERRFNHINHGFKIVPEQQFVKAANIAWENVRNFISEKEIRPLWYYLHMNDTPEAELKLLLGCVNLEIIQNIETENMTVDVPTELQELIDIIINNIDTSKIENELKNRLKGTVRKWGESGSAEKFRQFLIKYGIIDYPISSIPKKRVNSINQFRNGVVHSGVMRKPDWIKNEEIKTKVVVFYAGQFIPGLIEEYLNRKFGLKNFYWPQQTFKFLKEYIENGIWDGEYIEKSS